MSINKPWYVDRLWHCRWCGEVMPEHSLYYGKNKRRDFCNSRCLHDFKNFMERMFGKARLKAIINHKNKALDAWIQLLPFELIERKPMKPISQHITTLLFATDFAEPLKSLNFDKKTITVSIVSKKHLN